MILDILSRTPLWVFVLFAALVWLGLSQVRTRSAPFIRLLLLPAVMVAFSLYGVLAAFGDRAAALAPWLVALIATALALVAAEFPKGASYADGRYTVRGSWLPFAVIMAIFFSRYAISVMLAMEPSLRESAALEAVAGLLYGLSSGFFVGRTLGILRSRRAAAA